MSCAGDRVQVMSDSAGRERWFYPCFTNGRSNIQKEKGKQRRKYMYYLYI